MNMEIKEKFKETMAEEIAERLSVPSEVVIREGQALPAKEPLKVDITGQIDSPTRWLEKRAGIIDHKKAFIAVNREAFLIRLVIDEKNAYHDEIAGKLQLSEQMRKMGINSGEYISAFDMAALIKANRTYFQSTTEAMKLVSELRNFKAKVDKEIEASDDRRGNTKFLRSQIVESNLPSSFKVEIPVFKGMPKQVLEIEVEINPDNLSCTLVSPEANDTVITERDAVINGHLARIEQIAPDIVIIEV